ncbi:hypothetical protein L1887_28001 [Cichorium endivia]|nr:hypothetical protein L1887_28001 [Cichorium endivia]
MFKVGLGALCDLVFVKIYSFQILSIVVEGFLEDDYEEDRGNMVIFMTLTAEPAYAVTALMKVYCFEKAAGRKFNLLPECQSLLEELFASHSSDLQQRFRSGTSRH